MTFLFYRDQRQNREHGLIVLLANGCLSRLTTPAINTVSLSCNEECQYLRTLTYSVLKLEILAGTTAVCIALCFSLAQTLPWEKNKKLITCFVPIVRVWSTWWESLLAMQRQNDRPPRREQRTMLTIIFIAPRMLLTSLYLSRTLTRHNNCRYGYKQKT